MAGRLRPPGSVGSRPGRVVGALVAAISATTVIALAGCVPGGDGERAGSSAAGSVHAPSRSGDRALRRMPALWRAAMSSWPLDVVADADGVAVVLFDAVSWLDPSSGAERWRHDGRVDLPDGVALGSTTVALASGGRVAALDRDDGRSRWETGANDDLSFPSVVPAANPEGDALVTAFSTYPGASALLALAAGTGERRWTVRSEGIPTGPLLSDPGGSVVVGVWSRLPSDPSGSVLRALDPVDGTVLWERPGGRRSRPVITGGLVAVVESGAGRTALRAYEVRTGEVAWAAPVASPVQDTAGPAVGPAGMAVAGELGTVALVDPVTGRRRWESRLAAVDVAVLRSPVVGRSEILVPMATSALAVVDASDGSVSGVLGRGVAVGPARAADTFVTGWRWLDPPRVDARSLRRAGSAPGGRS